MGSGGMLRRRRDLAAMAVVAVSIASGGAAAAGGEGWQAFSSEASERGVSYTMPPWPTWNSGVPGFGMLLADLGGSGDLDLLLLGRSNGLPGIFENLGHGQFANRSFTSGIPPLPAASVALAFDFDNDGLQDLFLGQLGEGNRLYRNLGGFQFADATGGSGLDGSFQTKGACVADFDGDGWLDLYLCNFHDQHSEAGRRNRLYRNLGNGHFAEVAASMGGDLDMEAPSFQCAWTDVDGDSWPDLHVVNDRGWVGGPNRLFLNRSGTLVDATEATGLGVAADAMCLAVGDLDGDLRPDFYVTNSPNSMPPLEGSNALVLSGGAWPYTLAQEKWGVAHHQMSWGGLFWDFDNDGLLDLYVNTELAPNSLYRQVAPGWMEDVAEAVGLTGTADASFVSIVGDLDGDGDLDLVQNNHGGSVRVYINHEGERRNWLRLRVLDPHRLGDSPAAQAEIRFGSGRGGEPLRRWSQVIVGGNSYLGQNESILHFGLGDHAFVEEIVVRWPAGGPERVLRNLPANRLWTAYPPSRLGDADGSGSIDAADLDRLLEWLGEPLEPGREMLDLDGDGAIDAGDLDGFFAMAASPRADLDLDGVVGGADLAMLLVRWGSGDPLADLDRDGTVGGGDLAAMLASWSGR